MLEKGLLTTVVLMLALLSSFAAPQEKDRGEEVVFEDGDREWRYRKIVLSGWTIHYEASLWTDRELVGDLNDELRASFQRIVAALPTRIVAKLRKVPIWVSDEPDYPLRPGERGVIPFHRSEQWLREHGLNPHMAPGVHVINPRAVLYDHKVFEWGPMTILHELAHAHHNLHLGLDHAGIASAYANAMEQGLYRKVPSRSDPTKEVEAYAATNAEEYFAELTEAYFGRNDWFPHTRDELREYDPAGHDMIAKAWAAKAAK